MVMSYMSPVRYRFRPVPFDDDSCKSDKVFGKKFIYSIDDCQFSSIFGIIGHGLGDSHDIF